MSESQKCLFLLERLGKFGLGTSDVPTPNLDEILVEIRATALNPVDWKIQVHDFGGIVKEYPAVLGTDSAGIVKAVGKGVTKFAVGDRMYVWFCYLCSIGLTRRTCRMHQGFFTKRLATFQQYTTVPEELAAKVLFFNA